MVLCPVHRISVTGEIVRDVYVVIKKNTCIYWRRLALLTNKQNHCSAEHNVFSVQNIPLNGIAVPNFFRTVLGHRLGKMFLRHVNDFDVAYFART